VLNKRLTNTAMTLAELIIASILVGIVTLGLIAAEQAVRMSRQSSHRDAQISAQLQSAMIKLNRDASSTVGDATDTGIYQYSSGNDRTICFRQAAGDANIYTDDVWNCWWTNTSSRILASCGPLANPLTTCAGQASLFNWVTLTLDATTYTTFYSVIDNTQAVITPLAPWYILNKKISYIQLDLRSRFNPAANVNPIENPDYALNARISPTGLSR
jgi:Tfp pilus assembly protein PilV